MPVCAVDLEALARWAGLQRCSFAPGRLFEHDARGQRRQGLEQRCCRPGPRGLSCNYCSRAYSSKRCKPVRVRLRGQCDVSQQGGDVGTRLAHRSNSSGRSGRWMSTVPARFSAATSTRLSLAERACRTGGRSVPRNDESPCHWEKTTSRGHAAFPPRCSSRSAIQTPLWRPSALAATAPEEGQMRIEDGALEVSVPDRAPRLRMGQRRDGEVGRS